jgi:DNA-binding CsgD family transcriptional regulator
LSQYVEIRQAVKLLQNAPQRVGYLLKDRVSDITEFTDAVRRIARGGSVIDPEVVAQLLRRREDGALADLTGRERDILALMAQGRSNRAIGNRLFLSPKTVETHVGAISPSLACYRPPTTTGESSPSSPTSRTPDGRPRREHMTSVQERLSQNQVLRKGTLLHSPPSTATHALPATVGSTLRLVIAKKPPTASIGGSGT